ncbi:MAG: YafY family transcriptional regulator [Rhodothermia bacterium]|nr:YafY family transcriptional regulator [Rhodothermia bacterium]
MSHKERRKNRTDRLFEMVLLLRGRRQLTTRDLSEHFGVSRRTIFRDLRTLSESGVPLAYDEEGGYEILDGYQLPPLMLSGSEASTLLIGLEFMKMQSDPVLKKNADRVELKIQEVLPSDVKKYIDDLKASTILDPYWLHTGSNEGDDESRWQELSKAVTDRRVVSMTYFVESRGEVTKRQVNPLGLIYYTDHWNLIAYDQLREDVRNFRFDRIRELFVTMQRFQPPAEFDLRSYVQESFDAEEERTIRVFFDSESYGHARRSIPARIRSEESVDGGFVVTFGFDNLAYIARWLLRFGTHAKVLEPKELITAVQKEAKQLAALYGSG